MQPKIFLIEITNVIEKKEGMPVAVWIRAGHDGTGTSIQMKSILKGLKWRLVQEILICKGRGRINLLINALT